MFSMNTLKRALAAFIEILEIAAIAIVTVLLIRNYLIQPFLVNGASMEPNFSNNDYLLIDELTYRFREPERGEVVVFRYPGDKDTFYIKRIIALPGERLELKGGKVNIYNNKNPNGIVLEEEYLSPGLTTSGGVDVTLNENEYFVLGDNRSYSFDSRNWGTLPRENFIGVARLRLWPFTKVSAFGVPLY